MSGFKVGNNYKNLPADTTPKPLGGEICFVGVTRTGGTAMGGTGNIIDFQLEVDNPSPRYTISNATLQFFGGLGDIYNTTITGATFNNVSSYVFEFDINITNPTTKPIVIASPTLNPTGNNNAVVNQILAIKLLSSPEKITLGYAIVIFGQDQEASDDLIEQLFTTNLPFKSCINFLATFL